MRAHKRLLTGRRVIVNLSNGKAVAGVLVDECGPLIVLRAAELLEPGAEPVAVDGETVVDRDRIDFIQAL